jgi:hypothetical protein
VLPNLTNTATTKQETIAQREEAAEAEKAERSAAIARSRAEKDAEEAARVKSRERLLENARRRAEMDAERARERNERTEEARLLTASNLEAARVAEERAQRQAAWRSEAQWKVHCDKVRAKGEARRAQGQRAIAWGGTEEAEAQRKHQEERAKRTATARTKSSAHVARARYEELLSTQKRDEEETRERRRWEQEMVDRHARNKSEGEEALRLAQEEKARIEEQNEKCVKLSVFFFFCLSHL